MTAWINSSLLPNLRRLDLVVQTLDSQHLEILGMFPDLLTLKLWSPQKLSFEVMGNNGTLPGLRYFAQENVIRSFLQGAMPNLQSILVAVKVPYNNFDFGSLRNLTCLEEVTVQMQLW